MVDEPAPEPTAPEEDMSIYAYPFTNAKGDSLGLTIRQWYAGQALAGLFSNPEAVNMPGSGLALMAFSAADHMIAYEAAEEAGFTPPLAGQGKKKAEEGLAEAPEFPAAKPA